MIFSLGNEKKCQFRGHLDPGSWPPHNEWIFQELNSLEVSKLVGGLEHFLFSHILGISSSPLTFIFFRGVAEPPTRKIFWGLWGRAVQGNLDHSISLSDAPIVKVPLSGKSSCYIPACWGNQHRQMRKTHGKTL